MCERNEIVFSSKDEIIEINELLGYSIINEGMLDFLLTKIKSVRKSDNPKKDISKIAAMLWFEIITLHPFVDGNKRTATEAMKLLLKLNNYQLNVNINGIIYFSLKTGKNPMDLN